MTNNFPTLKAPQRQKRLPTTSLERRMNMINEITNNGKCWWLYQYLIGFLRTGGSISHNET